MAGARGPACSRQGAAARSGAALIIPALRENLSIFVKDEPGALVFPGAKG
jgi:hypothetical protein